MVKFNIQTLCKITLATLALSTSAKKKNGLRMHRQQNGLDVISGEESEIENLRRNLDREVNTIQKSKNTNVNLNNAGDKISQKYSSLKLMIQQQMVKDVIRAIHPLTMDGRPWNVTMHSPPLRGSYDSITLTSDLEQLGLKKSSDGKEILPKSHYCKYRTPSEVDGDKYSCCVGENTECYTSAGCFCDESCYTKYGDCCTDHFLTCYEHLKLCLIRVDTANNDAETAASQNKVSQGQREKYVKAQDSGADLIQGRSATFGGPDGPQGPKPQHIEPNACCLQAPFNTNEQNEVGDFKNCCRGLLTYDVCTDENEEESF